MLIGKYDLIVKKIVCISFLRIYEESFLFVMVVYLCVILLVVFVLC